MQAELDRAEAELSEKKEELRNLKDQIRTESAEMVARRRRFEVVMAENQASVAALTRRLAQSEAEVEQLQKELQANESSIQEYREILETITNNSKKVENRVHNISNVIDEKVEVIDKMEVASITEIKSVQSMFDSKFENLRNVIIDELSKSQKNYDDKIKENLEVIK